MKVKNLKFQLDLTVESMSGLTEYERKELKEGFKLLNKDGDDLLSFEDLKTQLNALKFPYDDQQIQDLLLVALFLQIHIHLKI